MNQAKVLLLPAVFLPPRALEHLGECVDERHVDTPWGRVGPIALRRNDQGVSTYILPYSGHPTRLDPRGTIWAAKTLGVQRVLLWERLVGLDHTLHRGDIVIPDDYIDWTRRLPTTLFEDRGAGYLSQIPPFCPETHRILREELERVGGNVHRGIYIGVDGPRRETPAEARMYQKWGATVLGMNAIPEVVFTKELELCFGVLGTVTEIGADRPPETARGEVRHTLRLILERLAHIVDRLSQPPTCTCHQSQSSARERGLLPEDWRQWRPATSTDQRGE